MKGNRKEERKVGGVEDAGVAGEEVPVKRFRINSTHIFKMRSEVLVEMVGGRVRVPHNNHTSQREGGGDGMVGGAWLYHVHDLSLKTLRDREHAVKTSLPHDPRTWSREDVHRWLHHVSEAHQLPRVFPERFLMNGKALCLMTLDMFVQRVPLGGKLLYKDFQLRLCNAMYA
ncbi:hypothetical protein Pmani_007547 [Petrolisthes manimaculis]|uniref:PNT domain-containing protein n=1 Tax=Petrolisthes manimaculis TaxID=1843537 RepID=A0AAE1Q869_9EUCA|nr:hypothetical protein Pmani_007547 [Petrolisthes manimaculis]